MKFHRQIDVAGSLLHNSSSDQYVIHNEKLKMHKSPGTDQNLAHLAHKKLDSEIYKREFQMQTNITERFKKFL
jgi:hypothetical protein